MSYSRRDGEFVLERLRPELHTRGHQVWVDVDITGGAKWRERVKRGIEACKALIFVVSPDAVASEACRHELEDAVALNKLIIPVVYRDVDSRAMPRAVAEAEWVFLRDRDDPAAGLDRLVDALETDLEWRDQHTRLAGRTREWLDSSRDNSYLLRGSDLRSAEAWLGQHEGHREAPTREQAEYIARSRQAAGRRLYGLVGALATGLAIAIGLAIFALIQRQHAIDQTHASQSQLVASQVKDTPDLQLASLQAVEAYRLSPTFDARDAVLTVAESRQAGSPLKGHTDTVSGLAFSPDGRILASSSLDHTIRFWSVASHRQLGRPLSLGLTDYAGDVAFSPDGRTLASANLSGEIQLWNVASQRPFAFATLFGHTGPVERVVFSPDGRTLASASDDSTIRLWDVANRRELGGPLMRETGILVDIAFSPDGRTLAAAPGGRTIRLWDVASRRPFGRLTGHTDDVLNIKFANDERLLSEGADDTVRIWDVPSHQQIGRPIHAPGTNVAFGPSPSLLVAGGTLWDLASRSKTPLSLTGNVDTSEPEVFSPDGRLVATAASDHTVRLWKVAPYGEIGALIGHGDAVNSVAFSPDGSTLASASADRTIRLWSVASWREIGQPLTGHSDAVVDVAFSPDRRTLASAGDDHTVRFWDLRTHRQRGPPLRLWATNNAERVAFSPDGRMLAAATQDYTILLWTVATHRQIARLGRPPDPRRIATGSLRTWDAEFTRVWDVAFSPDGRTLASGHDGAVRLWNVSTHSPIGPPLTTGNRDAVFSVAFSPDGKTLASGGGDQTVRLWDVASHRLLGRPFTGNTDWVLSVAWSPDGRMLAAASRDGTMRLWVVGTYRQLGAPLTDFDWVYRVAFSPDGRMLASASRDGTIRLWSTWAPGSIDTYRRQLCDYIDLDRAPQLWHRAYPSIPYERPC